MKKKHIKYIILSILILIIIASSISADSSMERHKKVEQKIIDGKIPALRDGTIITTLNEFNKLHEREKKQKKETILKIQEEKEPIQGTKAKKGSEIKIKEYKNNNHRKTQKMLQEGEGYATQEDKAYFKEKKKYSYKKIKKELLDELEKKKRIRVELHLKEETDENSYSKILKTLEQGDSDENDDFRLRYNFDNLNILIGYADIDAVNKLEDDPNVELIEDEEILKTQRVDSQNIMNITPIHSMTVNNSPVNGSGFNICLIDSGVDYNHEDFECVVNMSDYNDSLRGCLVVAKDFVDEDNDPMDSDGHGTHIAGILHNVSPESNIIAVRVCNGGACQMGDHIQGIRWCEGNSDTYDISVFSVSIGSTGQYAPNCTSLNAIYDQYFEAAYNKGIFMAYATGNDHSTTGICYPACKSYTISVGATYINNEIRTSSNRIPGAGIPDIWAVGTAVTSTCLGGGYCDKSGSSIATPFIAASAALTRHYYALNNQTKTVEELRTLFKENGDNVTDYVANYTRLNLKKVFDVDKLYDFCEDNDGDGFNGSGFNCGPIDCDDNNNSIYPGAVEICNNVDDNCNGTIDEGFDNDNDNYTTCSIPIPDCNDNNASINPGATEICNNVDDDCDTITDNFQESCGTGNCSGNKTCNAGAWGNCDTNGNDAGTCALCDATGTAIYDGTQNADCNPFDLPEIAQCDYSPDDNFFTWDSAPGFDSVCSALYTCTQDTYTFTHTCNLTCGAECEINNDCQETVCDSQDACYSGTYRDYNNVSSICLGNCSCADGACTNYTEIITDNDGDTYDVECENDCDDNNNSIYPGAPEIFCNGIDEDCNGADLCSQCADTIDNDGDGWIDFPDDPGCDNITDDDEFFIGATQCSDNIDNDGDGLIDGNDPSCTDALDNNEFVECNDNIDNDGDYLIDMDDPGCADVNDEDESDATSQCQDGIDNDGDGAVDMDDFSCINPQDNDEATPLSQCQDGIDNDGDNATDMADIGCESQQDNDEDPCTIPAGEKMIITQDTYLCPGTYNLLKGIDIRADNIILNCNGAVLQGNEVAGGLNLYTGIFALDNNKITIKNCNITGYIRGIALANAEDSMVISNNVYSNDRGIEILSSGDNNSITNNNLYSNNYNINLLYSTNSIVGYNKIISNLLQGITLSNSQNNDIIMNKINQTKNGITLSNSNLNNINFNNIYSTDFSVDFDNSDNNNIEYNNLIDNKVGIELKSTSNGNIINNNVICGRTATNPDIYDGANNNGDENTCDYASNWDDQGTIGCTNAC